MNYLQIQKFRKKAKITQDDLAQKLGVNRATISKYESGAISPSISQLHKISEILDVPIIDLLAMESDSDSKTDNRLLSNLIEDYARKNGDLDSTELYKIYYFDENGLRFLDGGSINKLIAAYDSLNEEGQQKAIERVEELTEIPKYQKKSPEE